MQRYQATQYPKIFKNTFWGNGQTHTRPELDLVIPLRNHFVEKYNIKSYTDYYNNINLSSDDRLMFDHVEAYNVYDNSIVLFVYSNYNYKDYLGVGEIIFPIYSTSAVTRLIILEKKGATDKKIRKTKSLKPILDLFI